MNPRLARLGLALVLALAPFGLSARGQDVIVDARDRLAIREVINGQIEAFRRDDGEAAFAFAAPPLREKFGDALTFMRMVRENYQAVYRPRKVAFGELVTEGARAPIQRVYLVDPDGRLVSAQYIMERQPDGSWRIGGVHLGGLGGDGPA